MLTWPNNILIRGCCSVLTAMMAGEDVVQLGQVMARMFAITGLSDGRRGCCSVLA